MSSGEVVLVYDASRGSCPPGFVEVEGQYDDDDEPYGIVPESHLERALSGRSAQAAERQRGCRHWWMGRTSVCTPARLAGWLAACWLAGFDTRTHTSMQTSLAA